MSLLPSLRVTKEKKDRHLVYNLIGPLDEKCNLDLLIDETTPYMRIGLKGLSRVNSYGVREWIRFFTKLTHQRITYEFFECSPAAVQQINLVKAFMVSGKVESVYLPYFCEKCRSQLLLLCETKSFDQRKPKIPEMICPSCKIPLHFDELPEEYLAFVKK